MAQSNDLNREKAYKKIKDLTGRFDEQKPFYLQSTYNETQTRRDFIDPFFKALGWDIDNENGYAESYREVIHEDRVKIGNVNKAPDYSFRLVGGKRLFFVEAKKPSVLIKEQVEPAFQVRRYGWSAKLPISIITDFQEFAVYDCTKKPFLTDKAATARIKYLTYDDYLKDFGFLWDTFSKQRVLEGSFDKFLLNDTYKKGTTTVDREFLQSLDSWRTQLAISISKSNKHLDEDEINFAVQQTIDRIIFLRIAEDRSIETYGSLKDCIKHGNLYQNLYHLFVKADEKYNSGLFDFNKDKISHKLEIENKVLKNVLNELYFPCPYEFSVLPVEILGTAYEQFLGKQIRIDKNHRVSIEEKPAVRKAGGVYYTPQYIVEYIVKNTIGKLVEGKTPKEIEKLKIVDPACGSGSFLLGAYEYLLNWHKDFYNQTNQTSKGGKTDKLTPEGNLSTAEKKRILLNNIYGVDLDTNAVEVTKLSLLIKCMEGETEASITTQMRLFHDRILPTLDHNIKSGNSLIDLDYYDNELDFGDERKIKPFNWQKAFPEVFKQGGFDAVIGNPPYVMAEIEGNQKKYLINKYKNQEGKPDLYRIFTEFSQAILKDHGYFSFIIPNSILTTPSCTSLRKFLMCNSGKFEILNFQGRVFENASINSIILTTQKKGTLKYLSIINNTSAKPDSNSILESEKNKITIDIAEITKNKDFQIPVSNNKDVNLVLNKIKKGSVGISEMCSYTLGMQVYHNTMHKKTDIENRIYHSDRKVNATYFPEIGGSNVLRYNFIDKNKEFVSYGEWCYNKPEWKFCSKERILIREIPGKQGLNCCLTDKTNIPNKAIIIVVANKISNHLLLGILNSKLMGFYVLNSTEKGIQKLFPRVSLTTLKGLPLKIDIHESIRSEIEKNVILIVRLHENLKESFLESKREQIQSKMEYSEKKINQLVYRLYNLTEEEIKMVEESFST